MSLEKIAFAEPDPEILKRVRWGGGGGGVGGVLYVGHYG